MQKKEFNNNVLYLIIISLILLLGLILRTIVWVKSSILWGDEANILMPVVDKSFLNLLLTNFDYSGEQAPPLFLMSAKVLYKIFGINDIGLRLFSYLSSVAALFAFFFLTKKVFKNKTTILVSNFIFATNMSLLLMTDLLKPYISDVLICILIMLFCINNINTNFTPKKIIKISIVCFLFCLLSFPSLFLILCCSLIFMFKNIYEKNKENYPQLALFSFLMFCFFITYNQTVLFKLRSDTYLIEQWKETYGYFPNSQFEISSLVSYLFNSAEYFAPAELILTIVFCTLLALGVIKIIHKYIFDKNVEEKYTTTLLIAPIIFGLTLGALSVYPFANRLVEYLLPCLIYVLTIPFENNGIKNNLIKNFVTIGLLCLLITYISFSKIPEMTKDILSGINVFEFPRATILFEEINREKKPDDIIYPDPFLQFYIYNKKYKIPEEQCIYNYGPYYMGVDYNDIIDKIKDKKTIWFVLVTMEEQDNPEVYKNLSVWINKNCSKQTTKEVDWYKLVKCEK